MSLSNNNIQFQKLSENATKPSNSRPGDAGYDLSSAHDIVIPPGKNALVKTDLCVRLPDPPIPGTSVYARIGERSGIALRNSIGVMGGIVDSNYRGNVGVIMVNFSDTEFSVKKGDRVAQMILEVCLVPEVEEVDNIYSEVTARGYKGFGSTGS